MSYNEHNLDQAAGEAESFPFTLNGNQYTFSYPTTEEVSEIFSSKLPSGDPDMEAVMSRIYSYIKPVSDGAPGIEDALKGAKVPKMKAFQDMVLKEFGLKE